MSDGEIRFGDVAETPLIRRARLDRDPRWCVVPCLAPQHGEPTIYVDLDTMREIEAHAISNTQVELGGVLLGGQYVDEQGLPFVIVEDTIRAERYEATKGSFKFTHETWEAISRRRDEYPEGIAMVGWYHTHPDWGVFLSGMDLFICRNFFSRPLDLALVVDPCRDERGWFCWRSGSDRPEQTAGFYLYTSRFRIEEATAYARSLEGTMPSTTAARTIPSALGTSSPTLITVPAAPRNILAEVLLVVILALQTLVCGVLVWQSGANGWSQDGGVEAVSGDRGSATQQQVIERLLMERGDAASIAQLLPQYQLELDELRKRLEGQITATTGLAEQLQIAQAATARAERLLAESREESRQQREASEKAQRELEVTKKNQAQEQAGAGIRPWYRELSFLAVLGVTAVVGLLSGAWLGVRGRIVNQPEAYSQSRQESEESVDG